MGPTEPVHLLYFLCFVFVSCLLRVFSISGFGWNIGLHLEGQHKKR